jgi:hypothetical protein
LRSALVSLDAPRGDMPSAGRTHDPNVGYFTPRRLLVLGTAGLFLARILVSLTRTGPIVVADEIGYLTNARVLAGGVPGQMQGAPFYRGGYSVLLAPIVAIVDNPETAYRLVLVLNAMLAASLVPLLYLLLTRHFRVPHIDAAWAALAAACYPSITVFSQVALSENALLPLTVVWLLCWGELLRAGSRTRQLLWAAALGTCGTCLFAVHGRMLVAVTVTAVAALVVLVIIGLGYLPVRQLNRHLADRSYGGHTPDEIGQRLAGVGTVDGILSFARNVLGQSWYVAVTSLGLVVAFLLAGWLRSVVGLRQRRVPQDSFLLGLLLAMLSGLLVLSALSFHDVERPDMLFYGRYVEVVVPPILAIAIARLSIAGRLPSIRLVVGLIAAATVLVVLLRTTIDPVRGTNGWNIAAFPFVMRDLGTAPLLGAGVIACVAYAAAGLAVRRSPGLLAPLVLLLFLPTTAAAERNPVLSAEDATYPTGWTSPGEAAPRARRVAYDMDHAQGLYVDQWFMPDAHFVRFSGSSDAVPAPYVISSRAWAREHPQLRATELWHDPGRRHVLYRVADRR